jgi:hypothetical protein
VSTKRTYRAKFFLTEATSTKEPLLREVHNNRIGEFKSNENSIDIS